MSTETASQTAAAHKPISCLELFSGDWVGEEEIAPSRWGEGGKASALVSARLDLDRRVLIQDYIAQRDGKPWFKAHAVIAFDAQSGGFNLYWFDSMGFMPSEPAPGQWDGASLRFVRSSPRGQTRHSYCATGPDAYQLILESSFDCGATWTPVSTGRYARVGV